MQFLTIASLFAAAAVAVPAPQSTGVPDPSRYENVDITEFYLRKNDGIQNAGFKLSGLNATDLSCEIGAVPSLPSTVTTCGTSLYRFALTQGEASDYGLAIYHQTSPFAGKMAIADVPTYCHAGGNGADDFVCSQVGALTIAIKS